MLQDHNLFKDVTNINSSKFSHILTSKDSNDDEVSKLLSLRKLISITRSLTRYMLREELELSSICSMPEYVTEGIIRGMQLNA